MATCACTPFPPPLVRLRFAPTSETLATIARAVEAERHCCRLSSVRNHRLNPTVARSSWNSLGLPAPGSSLAYYSRCDYQPHHLRARGVLRDGWLDRKSTRLNSSHVSESRMPSSA